MMRLIIILLGPVLCSCISMNMPGKSWKGKLPELTAEQKEIHDQLKRHVSYLGSMENNVFQPRNQIRAQNYIINYLRKAGLNPKREVFQSGPWTCHNIVVDMPGEKSEIILLGAHYDDFKGVNGANDNGSGTAALMVLAAKLASLKKMDYSLRMVFFTNEEPPFFKRYNENYRMGSLVHAFNAKERKEKIVAMLSLETMGYYSDEKDSQKYPPVIGWFYPDKGNFLTFVANPASRKLLHRTVKYFRQHATLPSRGIAISGNLPGISWSDHWSFWQIGCPAIMITDTAPFRYPHYHKESDNPDKLDYHRFTLAVDALYPTLKKLLKQAD